MRLTLRTLLSYLDDTLEPAQAKAIGAKVAESEQARDLVERIKQVTRRRRLTTPPTAGPGGIDANTISEYLDNEVTPEKAAEVEQICLASDVHLAEVAACHQILTLVLGEPALVPPSAKQRMYGLVKGPEAIPFRKPAKTATTDDNDLSSEIELDQDEALRLGVPAVGSKGGGGKVWMFVGGGILAACVFVFAVYQLVTSIPINKGDKDTDKDKDNTAVAQLDKKDPTKKTGNGKDTDKDKDKDIDKDKPPVDKDKEEKIGLPKIDSKLPEVKTVNVDPNDAKAAATVPYAPPNKKQDRVGTYLAPGIKEPAVLLQEKSNKSGWARVVAKKEAPVTSSQMLMSLPGSKNVIALNSGVELTLWGNLFEVTLDPSTAESRATLHVHDVLDADLTLDRGRILVRNKKKDDANALVRVRFDDPMHAQEKYLELVLQTGAAVVVERTCDLDREEPFYEDPKNPMRKGPIATMRVFAFAGITDVRLGEQASHGLDAKQYTLAQWQNRTGTLATIPLPAAPAWFKGPPALKDKGEQLARDKAIEAHDYLVRLVDKENKQIDVALAEIVQTVQQNAQREIDKQKNMSLDTYLLWRHALRSMVAVDDVTNLFDTFAQDGTPLPIRGECIGILRQWLGQERDNEYKLLDVLRTKNAIKKTPSTKIMELFHLIPPDKIRDPGTYQILIEGLNNDLVPIRTLSHWHLSLLAPTGRAIPYDPAMPRDRRELAVREWLRLIPPGQVPPAPKQPTKKDKL